MAGDGTALNAVRERSAECGVLRSSGAGCISEKGCGYPLGDRVNRAAKNTNSPTEGEGKPLIPVVSGSG